MRAVWRYIQTRTVAVMDGFHALTPCLWCGGFHRRSEPHREVVVAESGEDFLAGILDRQENKESGTLPGKM